MPDTSEGSCLVTVSDKDLITNTASAQFDHFLLIEEEQRI